MQFDVGAWKKDPAVCSLTLAARAVWFDLLGAMHEEGRTGELRKTREQLAILARCSAADLDHALTDFRTTKAADVTEADGIVIVVNRRMRREYLRHRTPSMRSWITYRRPRLLVSLTRRDGVGCRKCGRVDNLQIDHKKPLAKGGTNELRNLQILCGECNRRKAAKEAS